MDALSLIAFPIAIFASRRWRRGAPLSLCACFTLLYIMAPLTYQYTEAPPLILAILFLSLGLFISLLPQAVRCKLPKDAAFDPAYGPHIVTLTGAVLWAGESITTSIRWGQQIWLKTTPPTVTGYALNFAFLVVITVLCVLAAKARSFKRIPQRLALSIPSRRAVLTALLTTTAIYLVSLLVVYIARLFISPQTISDATSLSIYLASNITTPSAILLTAFYTAFSEELAFRGGFQPIIGLWPTVLTFAAVHVQYLIGPGVFVMVILAVGTGLIRRHHGTTSAMLVHFLYNVTTLVIR